MNPKLIEGWLRSKAGIEDTEEIRVALLRTMGEQGVDVDPSMTFAELEDASQKVAGANKTQGLKRGEHGLYIEARQIKAAMRESVNILFAGHPEYGRMGPTRKGAKAYFVERAFVAPLQIWLDRTEPDGVETIIGHVTGPQGPRSTIGYVEYVQRPRITFDVLVTNDAIPAEWWPNIWNHMEENGIGALRSQSHGTFDIIAWDRVALTSSVEEPSSVAAD